MSLLKLYPRMIEGLLNAAQTVTSRWVYNFGIDVGASIRPEVDSAADIGVTGTRFRVGYFDDLSLRPSASRTPAANGDVEIELTNNTTLTFKAKGDDGVVRSGTVTLS
jgi:hypothetical protein